VRTVSSDLPPLDVISNKPHVLFLDTPDYAHRRVALAPLDDLDSRYVTDMTCVRVYAGPNGGICLGVQGTVAYSQDARAFDTHLTPGVQFDAPGVPSRVRISSSGQFASATVFVSGDSYGAAFSTRTFLFDVAAGQPIGNLEDFTVFNDDGAVMQAPDFNFWGTTFAADGDHFYATLGVGGVGGLTYLVKGDVASRRMDVLRTNVECPSLSPDGRHIAFKKRINNIPDNWRISVLDLDTLQDQELNETNSVDDQVEWLDDNHVLYAMPRYITTGLTSDIWVATVDGSQPPRVFLENALSPAVVR